MIIYLGYKLNNMNIIDICVGLIVCTISTIISWNICPTSESDNAGHLVAIGLIIGGGWIVICIIVAMSLAGFAMGIAYLVKLCITKYEQSHQRKMTDIRTPFIPTICDVWHSHQETSSVILLLWIYYTLDMFFLSYRLLIWNILYINSKLNPENSVGFGINCGCMENTIAQK